MEKDSKHSVDELILVGKLDAKLCRIKAEKKQLEAEFLQVRKALLGQENKLASQKKSLDEKKSRYSREERQLKDERAKLVERRKSLQTLGAYKLQQAAQREIEHASRQLDVHEEALLKLLEEIERLEQAVAQLQSAYDQESAQFQKKAKEINEALQALDLREQDSVQERKAAIATVDPELLKVYDRVKERFGTDPLASLDSTNTCSGCFMKVGPQIAVQVARGQGLIKCPGCGRILYLEGSAEE